MRTSVLIATRDRPSLLEKTLASLSANTTLPDEVIIIDQSADDRSAGIVGQAGFARKIIRYEKALPQGKAAALNRAVHLARGELLGLTDDDVSVDRRWLETALGLAESHTGTTAFCGRVLPATTTRPHAYVNLVLHTRSEWMDVKRNPIRSGFCGANLFLRREACFNTGLFDPRFGPGAAFRSNEDGEFAYRLAKNGHRILYAPELIVYHAGWRSEHENWQLTLNYAFGIGAFAGHYLKQRDPAPPVAFLKTLAIKSGRLLLGCLMADRNRIRDGALHTRGYLAGFHAGLTKGLR